MLQNLAIGTGPLWLWSVSLPAMSEPKAYVLGSNR